MVTKSLLFIAMLFLSPRVTATDFRDFQSADIIFQTSSSRQSYAIMWASKSLYSHVGVVEKVKGKLFVIEAISKVSRTPLEKWIARGRLGRFAIYRLKGISPEKAATIVDSAKTYLGRGYDLYFTSGNKEIYCSELVTLAYGKAGLDVGKWQKESELDVDNVIVRKLAKTRWRRHPVCKGVKTFEACWKLLMDDKLITPESISRDAKLELVYSNY